MLLEGYFTYKTFQHSTTSCIQYINCTLIKKIGTHKKGEKFDIIALDSKLSTLTLERYASQDSFNNIGYSFISKVFYENYTLKTTIGTLLETSKGDPQ